MKLRILKLSTLLPIASAIVTAVKNRLEVDHTKHRIKTELGAFKDDLRIIKD
jgi:hypothetical protein